jgi:hypothetical protein
MSNPTRAQSSREEEIAFLAMEQVLKVDIKLADAGAGDKMPDGRWVYTAPDDQEEQPTPDARERVGIVEVTSPPATDLLREWARAKKTGQPQSEGGTIDLRLGELAKICTEMLAEAWALENIDKLLAQPADERHLFLFARGHKEGGHYFYRLTDSYEGRPPEHVDDLVLPEGITDLWFRGRSKRDPAEPLGKTEVWLARFQAGTGWHRYTVPIEEQHLPSPNRGIADDPVAEGWRLPKNRAVQPGY